MKKHGFTLVEVIVVITLVTVILGLSTVYFAGFLPAAKLGATGREITALLRHTRSLARMEGVTHTVMLNLDDRTYGIVGKATKSIPDHVLIKIEDPVNGEILHGKYPLIFPAAGGLEGGTIILSGGEKKIRIALDPLTGATMIKDRR